LTTLENNWRFKSLESLEKTDTAPVPRDESSVVQRLSKLRQLPINEFQVDDIRFMIIQGIGLQYLLIEAMRLLKYNILTEGNYYEGDLLNAVLKLHKEQWKHLQEHWYEVDALINGQLDYLKTIRPELDIDNFYSCRPK
jgi:hypothetical protein